jgi:prenyltransferase beta subunit
MSTKNSPHSIELFDTLRRAPVLLNSEARNSIADFISGQLTPEGGFCNRAGVCDQYYTMFGLTCAATLNIPLPLPKISHYLRQCPPETLDQVHLVCWVKSKMIIQLLRWQRCYPLLRLFYRWGWRFGLKTEPGKFRSADGGFSNKTNDRKSNPYAIFMGLNLYQDCGVKMPDIPGAIAALERCRTEEGAFHNPLSGGQEMLLSTSAAMLSLRQLTGKIDSQALAWMVQQQGPTGGFHASPNTQMPDLLSTAVALFTLRVCGYSIDLLAGTAREFILDHWHENGGFTGTLVDECADCEYTFYALMALGALAK